MGTNMKCYDLVKSILRDYPEARDSDNALEWYYYGPALETARRSKQTIQNKYHLYEKSPQVKKWTQDKAKQKGTHIFRETIVVYDEETGMAREE